MDLSFFLVMYTFFIFMFFNSSSFLVLWVLMEINLVLFIMLFSNLFFTHLDFKMDQAFIYLIVQSIGSFFFLFGFIYSDYFKLFNLEFNYLIFFAFLIKMGLYPLHYWIYKMVPYSSNLIMFLLLSIQKIPLMFIFFSMHMDYVMELMFVNLFYGSLFLSKNFFIKDLLISSSLYSMVWFLMFYIMSPYFFFTFMINYIIFLYYLMILDSFMFLKFVSSFYCLLVLLSTMFFVGFPPLGMFFFKFFSMELILNILNFFTFLILWTFTFFSTVGYFNFFFYLLFFSENLYQISADNFKMILFLIFFFCFFMFI